MIQPASYAQGRSIVVPQGKVVRSGYVDVFAVRLACRERMAIGDIDCAYQKRLQLAPEQPWPCPTGYWDDDTFVIIDGRHEWIASVAIGLTHILVAWLAEADDSGPGAAVPDGPPPELQGTSRASTIAGNSNPDDESDGRSRS